MGKVYCLEINYFVSDHKGSNYCWHIDGNDKLLPYGFAIHGCIDGYVKCHNYCNNVTRTFPDFHAKYCG